MKRIHFTPEWWYSFFHPQVNQSFVNQVVQPPGHTHNRPSSGNSSSGNNSSGSADDRQMQVRQLTRRLVCGLFSTCSPELLPHVDMAMQLATHTAQGLLAALQPGRCALDATPGSSSGGSSSSMEMQAVEEEISVCRDAVQLLTQGKEQQGKNLLTTLDASRQQDGAVQLYIGSHLVVPVPHVGEAGDT